MVLALVCSCSTKHCGTIKSKEMVRSKYSNYCYIMFEDGYIIDSDLRTYMGSEKGQIMCVEGYEVYN